MHMISCKGKHRSGYERSLSVIDSVWCMCVCCAEGAELDPLSPLAATAHEGEGGAEDWGRLGALLAHAQVGYFFSGSNWSTIKFQEAGALPRI